MEKFWKMIFFVVPLLLGVLAPIRASADELVFYAYPSPLRISWRSPEELIWSAIFNELLDGTMPFRNKHEIGHVNFDLRCDPSPVLPQGARYVAGQTNSDDREMNDIILHKGYGLGALLAQYSGRWETQEEIEADLPKRFQTGMVAFIDFKISPSTCVRVASYLQQYVERGYDRIYGGLEDRPRYGEGAGCTAFGESVLEVAGLMRPEWYSSWTHSIALPNELIGGPATGRHVTVMEGLFGRHSRRWGSPGDSYPLTFWDPDYIFNWIRKDWRHPDASAEQADTPVSRAVTPVSKKKARGIQIDATQVPTPDDPFWLSDAS